MSQNGTENAALSYLSLGHLAYRCLSIEELRVKFNENPWGYQPVAILDSKNQPLEINDGFFRYLTENCYIDVHSLNANNIDLTEHFKTKDNQTSFLICTVDEYYMMYSKFYHKSHNKHFVLIKSIFLEDSLIEIIDSERNRTYQIPFDEIEQAIYKSIYKRKILYQVDGRHYKDCSDKLKFRKNYVTLNYDYLLGLIDDVEIKRREGAGNSQYYYEGYYYTILSKILPYFQMMEKMSQENQNKYYQSCVDLIAEWKNLIKYMRFKLYRGNCEYDQLLKKLNRILYKQKTIGFLFEP